VAVGENLHRGDESEEPIRRKREREKEQTSERERAYRKEVDVATSRLRWKAKNRTSDAGAEERTD
jgi:hypothetical protein